MPRMVTPRVTEEAHSPTGYGSSYVSEADDRNKKKRRNGDPLVSATKRVKLPSNKSAESVKRNIMLGEEENMSSALNKQQQSTDMSKPATKPEDTEFKQLAEENTIVFAAKSLMDLAEHFKKIYAENSISINKNTIGSEDPNSLDGEHYRKRAQELLFNTTDILVGERKDAFFELVRQLCPYIDIVRSGNRTLRTYLVDTRKKKRYRTYSDAIKGGALDPLILETGTVVLLKGCVEEAKRRYDQLLAGEC